VEAPSASVSQTAPPVVQSFQRTGSRSAAGLTQGLPFAGASAALQLCGQVRPCVVERWASDRPPASFMLLTRHGGRMWVDSLQADWPATWTSVSGPLPGCLGDPLAISPGDDPAAQLRLEHIGSDDARGWRWVLRLSGRNRCGLAGSLVLDAHTDRANASALGCDGLGWSQGGRDNALSALWAYARSRVTADWDRMSAADREGWLAILTQDPSAHQLVAELRARAPAQ